MCFLQQYLRELCLETIKTKLNDLNYRKHRGILTEHPPTLCLFGRVQISRKCLSGIVPSPHSESFLWLDSHTFQWGRKFFWMIPGEHPSLRALLSLSPESLLSGITEYNSGSGFCVLHPVEALSSLHSKRRSCSNVVEVSLWVPPRPHSPAAYLWNNHSETCIS